MKQRSFLLLVCLILLFTVMALPASAAVPTNDNFAAAQNIVLNTKIKTLDVNEAVIEVGEPVTCAGVNTPNHSVWYKFTAPFNGSISISTAGSYLPLNDGFTISADTVLTVFTGAALASLTQVECNDDASYRYGEIDDLPIVSGTTYYIRVNSYSESITVGSYFKLSTTVRDSGDYSLGAQDLNFEAGSPAWVLTNALNGDSRICATGEQDTFVGGQCAYKLIGGPFEGTQLVQKLTWPTTILLGKEDHFLRLYARLNITGSAPNVQLLMKIIYSDGTVTTKAVRKINAPTTGYTYFGVAGYLASPNVKTVKIMLKNKSSDGSTLVDNLSFSYYGGLTRDTGLLPLPAAK